MFAGRGCDVRGQADGPAGRPAAPQSAGSGRTVGHPGPAHTGTHLQDRIGPYQVPTPEKSCIWNKTKHPLQTLWMFFLINSHYHKNLKQINHDLHNYFCGGQNLRSYFWSWKGCAHLEQDIFEVTSVSLKIKKLRPFKVLMLASRL